MTSLNRKVLNSIAGWLGGGGGGGGETANPLPPRPMKGGQHGDQFRKLKLLADGSVPCMGVKTESASTAELTVESMYEVNPFTDTEDHGPWTQGFPIEYKTTEWDDVPLKIWVHFFFFLLFVCSGLLVSVL